MSTRTVCLLAATAATLSLIVSSPLQTQAQGRTGRDFAEPVVYQAAGPDVQSLESTLNQFRAAFGGINNGVGPGPIANGRREINWDGGGSLATSEAPTPFTGFLNSRGAQFETNGDGFVQAPVSGLATLFGNLSYESTFAPFSEARLFSPVGSNITDVRFFLPGSQGGTAAVTRGFAAVFSDVDQPDGSGPGGKRGSRGASTLVEYFGAGGELLYSSFVAASPGDATFSLLGVVFDTARVAHVRITTGDVAPGVDDEPQRDVVMMDDFVFGEPQPLP